MIFQLPKVLGKYKLGYELGRRSWFGVGGNVLALFEPFDADDLSVFLRCFEDKTKIKIIGNTSNLLISESVDHYVAIRITFNKIKLIDNDCVFVEAGVSDKSLSNFACKNNIGGFEFLSTIPGTVGGAICMNAGCFGSEISDLLIEAYAIDENGQKITIKNKDLKFKYRGYAFEKRLFFTGALFKGFVSEKPLIEKKISEFRCARLKSQPIGRKTFGSIFKNSKYESSWQLIDKAGCRGLSVGGAAISEKHCNFMINFNNATFLDAVNLKNIVFRKVKKVTGVELKQEVIIF